MESPRHLYQLCNRIGFHLLHHLTSVCFHSDLTDAELTADLFTSEDQKRLRT